MIYVGLNVIETTTTLFHQEMVLYTIDTPNTLWLKIMIYFSVTISQLSFIS